MIIVVAVRDESSRLTVKEPRDVAVFELSEDDAEAISCNADILLVLTLLDSTLCNINDASSLAPSLSASFGVEEDGLLKLLKLEDIETSEDRLRCGSCDGRLRSGLGSASTGLLRIENPRRFPFSY